MSGSCSTQEPITKKVARTPHESSASRTRGVVREGPSSNVNAILRRSGAPQEIRRGSVSPPARVHLRVARPRVRGAEQDDLCALGPALEVAHRLLRDTHRVPWVQLEDLVVELQACAPVDDDVDLLLFVVRMSERNAKVRLEPEKADARVLQLERDSRCAVFHVRRHVELQRLVLDLFFQVQLRIVGHRIPLVASGRDVNDLLKLRKHVPAGAPSLTQEAHATRVAPSFPRPLRREAFLYPWTDTSQTASRKSGSASGRTSGPSIRRTRRRAAATSATGTSWRCCRTRRGTRCIWGTSSTTRWAT